MKVDAAGQMCYNIECLDRRELGVLLYEDAAENVIFSIMGKAPLVKGFNVPTDCLGNSGYLMRGVLAFKA